MALANSLWGAPRIHGELLKLGFDISQRSVARLMPRRRMPPSQSWNVIVLDERHLRRRLDGYLRYHGARTHLSLAKDAPDTRSVEPAELGRVVALPQVGGLHHRYTRCAA
jgi:hypothetical protein